MARIKAGAGRPGAQRPEDHPEQGHPELGHPEIVAAEYEGEKPARATSGAAKVIIGAAAVAVSLYALYWVLDPQPAFRYRTTFLAVTLAMTLLVYRPLHRPGQRRPDDSDGADTDGADNPGVLDWALGLIAVVALLYPLFVFEEFIRRAVRPTTLDVVVGVVTVLLVLEATRRTVGWILPAICGGFLPTRTSAASSRSAGTLGHRGYDIERLDRPALHGRSRASSASPLDVAATYIVLFTIYGAVLEYSGAGKFFIDVSFAAFGSRPARRPGVR